MTDPMTAYDLIVAAGLDPAEFATKAWAQQTDDEHPALVSGTLYGGVFAVIRAWKQWDAENSDEPPSPFAHRGWVAVATVSRNPQLAIGELSPEESERLRAESQVAAGHDKPVGQEAVIGRSDPKPYAPPVPPVPHDTPWEGSATEIEEEIGALGPIPEGLGCGSECVRLKGPEGVQDYHGPGCTIGEA